MDNEEIINEIVSSSDYTDILVEISGKLDMINIFLCGMIFFIGIIAGLLFMQILWNRFNR